METGIAQAHLYYACKLYAEYFYEPGEQASNGSATGFIVESPEKNKFGLVTNHHFIEPGWCDARYDGTTLTKLRAKIWTTVAEGVVTDIISEPIFLDDDTIDACILPIRSDKMANV
ncbi:MAG: hypothetical protein ABWY39_01420, partial [Mycobacterium sp.]